MRTQQHLLVAVATFILTIPPAVADEYTKSPQLAQVGVNQSLQSSANYGQNIKIGIVDTGVLTTHTELSGRATTTCAAKTFFCFNAKDDNGHGTHVAGIAAGGLNSKGMVGVAPKASIVGMKVLNRNGSGYDIDVANGIRKAADAGTSVINLSLTYLPIASVTSAMNYAAGKNNYIVNAGGNSAAPLLNNGNSAGFTLATANRLILVGSVNASNTLSYFSNTPGTGQIITGQGNLSHMSRWIMAPGEGIYSSWYTNKNAYVVTSGTSMATPVVTGAIALLNARWPTLIQNGTADDILFASAQDLGAPGVDPIYGNGLLRVDKAFQPIGTVSATTSSGGSVSVSGSGSGVAAQGAMGSMPSLSARLSNYTAFDSFSRDFQMDFSSLVTGVEAAPMEAAQVEESPVQIEAVSFADGSHLAFGNVKDDSISPASLTKDNSKNWFLSFTDAKGSTVAAGYGFPGAISFTGALWGMDTPVANYASSMGGSTSLLGLAAGGAFVAFGTPIDHSTRMAFTWSNTEQKDPLSDMVSWAIPDAQAFGAGITRKMTDEWTLGSTIHLLNENSGLLGSTYGGPIHFGTSNQSMSFGISSAYQLAPNTSLVFDAAIVQTQGSEVRNSLISDVSALRAYALGAALVQKEAFADGDQLTFSIRQPLKVYSGSAGLAVTSVDAFGMPTTSVERIGLSPNATEVNAGFAYDLPVNESLHWNAMLSARDNAGNVEAPVEGAFRLGATYRF